MLVQLSNAAPSSHWLTERHLDSQCRNHHRHLAGFEVGKYVESTGGNLAGFGIVGRDIKGVNAVGLIVGSYSGLGKEISAVGPLNDKMNGVEVPSNIVLGKGLNHCGNLACLEVGNDTGSTFGKLAGLVIGHRQ